MGVLQPAGSPSLKEPCTWNRQHVSAGLLQCVGDVFSDRLARFLGKPLGEIEEFAVLGGCGIESLARFSSRQVEYIRHRSQVQETRDELERRGGIGLRDIDEFEPVVGRAPGVACVGLTQRLGEVPDRTLIFPHRSCACATPRSATSPNTFLENPNHGMPRLAPPFSPIFVSFSLTTSSPCSSETSSRDAHSVNGSHGGGGSPRSHVAIDFLVSFRPALETNMATYVCTVRSLCDSRAKIFCRESRQTMVY